MGLPRTMVGMARCAVPARVVAGGTNIRATLAIERIAPLHAARTSQRDVPTTLNKYSPQGRGRMVRCLLANTATEFAKPVCAEHAPGGGLFPLPEGEGQCEGKRPFARHIVSRI